MSTEPVDLDLARPRSWMEPTTAREADGSERPLPAYESHMMCDEDGAFPSDPNSWETGVLEAEMRRPGFLGWYRDPAHSSPNSLGVAYKVNDQFKILRPDFIFFSAQPDGTVAADIVDPHGTHFSDALPKLVGLCRYVERHPRVYRRIEAVAKVQERLRVLDLTSAEVREAITASKDAKSLYEGPYASDY